MSGLLNRLGLGHKDAAHDDAVAREAGHTHTATVEKAAEKNGAATTTTTTTTTNNGANTGLHHTTGTGLHGSTNATAVNTTAPYGSSSATSTSRTGAAYSNPTGVSTASSATAQQAGLFTERAGLTSDDAMTRSEEQLRVAKATVETGKAELNKYVETRHVEQAVPVQRERIVIEREPITAANIGSALHGQEISEAHLETTLHEDRIAATKETVPIERIRLAKQVETSVESVGADLRKEHIDFTMQQNDKIDHTVGSGLHGNKIDSTSTTHSGVHAGNTHVGATDAHVTNTTRSAY